MADWTDPPWTQLVAGKAWTDEKAAASFENVVAQAEGAPGAPKQMPLSLDLFLGELSFDETAAGLSGLGDLDGILIFWRFRPAASTSSTLSIRFSDDDGATWGSWQSVQSYGDHAESDVEEYYRLDLIGLKSGKFRLGSGSRTSSLPDFTIPGAGANAFQLAAFGSGGDPSGDATVFGFGLTE